MQIVPIINAKDEDELDAKIEIINQIYASYPQDAQWIQIDVADGSFTNGYDNWRSPDAARSTPGTPVRETQRADPRDAERIRRNCPEERPD